jgi:ABC-type Co2+ transport system permease subunit
MHPQVAIIGMFDDFALAFQANFLFPVPLPLPLRFLLVQLPHQILLIPEEALISIPLDQQRWRWGRGRALHLEVN